jgi:hypothetical protein
VFKSWFGRKPKRPDDAATRAQPAPVSASGQPVPRLFLADDPKRPQRPEGPRLPVLFRGPAMILTSEIETISAAALQAAVQRRAPQIQFGNEPPKEPQKDGDRPTALGYYPDFDHSIAIGKQPLLYGVSYIPNFNLEGIEKESYVTSCWWWPETRDVVARTRAHAVAAVLGDVPAAPPKERMLIEMQLIAAALDVLKTVTAVVLPGPNAMWKPELFLSEVKRAEGNIPITMAVAVKIGHDTEHLRADGKPKWFARTEGLNAFGMMEAEWRAFDGDVGKLVAWLSGVAWYLVTYGPIIAHEDSMGSDAPGIMPNLIIRHEPSTTVLGTRAYVVYPQPMN